MCNEANNNNIMTSSLKLCVRARGLFSNEFVFVCCDFAHVACCWCNILLLTAKHEQRNVDDWQLAISTSKIKWTYLKREFKSRAHISTIINNGGSRTEANLAATIISHPEHIQCIIGLNIKVIVLVCSFNWCDSFRIAKSRYQRPGSLSIKSSI